MKLSDAISTNRNVVRSDIDKTILPLLADFFNSIAKDTSTFNVIAQLAVLQTKLIAALPGIEHDALASIAEQINAEAQAALTPKA